MLGVDVDNLGKRYGDLDAVRGPSYGDAHVFGKSVVSEVRSVRRLVGIAPQDISLYPNLSAVENLDFFGRIYGVPSARLPTRAAELLDLVGLTARADER